MMDEDKIIKWIWIQKLDNAKLSSFYAQCVGLDHIGHTQVVVKIGRIPRLENTQLYWIKQLLVLIY